MLPDNQSPLYSEQELPNTAEREPTVIFSQLSQTITWDQSADEALRHEALATLFSEIMTSAVDNGRGFSISLEATLPPISVTLIHLTFIRFFASFPFSIINL